MIKFTSAIFAVCMLLATGCASSGMMHKDAMMKDDGVMKKDTMMKDDGMMKK